MIKIALAGANGRMGQMITELIENRDDMELAAKITRDSPKNILKNKIFNILIDFSNPEAALEHLAICSEIKCPVVIGVTGFNEKEFETIRSYSQKIPILWSPNMSIGVNIVYKLLEIISNTLQKIPPGPPFSKGGVDVSIHDIHHKHKKDAPSGTALQMGQVIANSIGKPLNETNIQFSSARLGEVPGTHTVLFALNGEQIELSHKAEGRHIFAAGALKASEWLIHQPPGLYDMQDVLGVR